MVNTRRILIREFGAGSEVLKQVFALTLRLCIEAQKPQNVVLLVPTKDQLENSGLATVLGEEACKALGRGNTLKLGEHCRIRLATKKTFDDFGQNDILLVVYASSQLLALADNAHHVATIVALPWTANDAQEWERVWKPQIWEMGPTGLSAVASDPSAELLPEVREGLKTLTVLVNLSTALSHPMDRGMAVALFKAFKKCKVAFAPVSVKSWAVHHGWTERGAQELTKIAQAVVDGKRLVAPDAPPWGRKFVEDLQEKARSQEIEGLGG